MSEEPTSASSRKLKRAQRDAERAAKFRVGGAKKTKPAAPAVPGGDEDGVTERIDGEESQVEAIPTAEEEPKQKPSKKRKISEDAPASKEQTAPTTQKRQKTAEGDGTEGSGKKRFIIFCGNLPYTTTDQSLEKHFEKLKPFSLRHRTDPKTHKSKGFAFIEFENYDRLKTCLKLYHHTFFDPEDPNAKDPELDPTLSSRDRKKSKGRKINVMLSAGGGGNTEARKEKIKVKNERLDGQRQRRQEAERKEKERKRKGQGGADRAQDTKAQQSGVSQAATSTGESMGGMHPSRLARIQ